MKLTSKGRYAVNAVLDLAMHQERGVVSLASIAQRQKISRLYLEQLFSRLRLHNIVTSVRGIKGGYRLARSPSEVNIAEIVEAVDGPVDATRCRGKADCRDGTLCLGHQLWAGLTEHVHSYLADISCEQILHSKHCPGLAARTENSTVKVML